MSKIIPNTFQTPNAHVDLAMQYLTGDEYKVLNFSIRHIYGWQDKIERRQGRISLSMFVDGYKTVDGVPFAGTGLSKQTVIDCLETLVKYKLLIKDGEPNQDGQMWTIGVSPHFDGLRQRQLDKDVANRARIAKARETRAANAAGGLSDNTTSKRSIPQTAGGIVPQTAGGLSDNTQTKPASQPEQSHSPNGGSKALTPIVSMKNAIKAAFYPDKTDKQVTKSEWGVIQAAAKQLVDAEALPENIPALYAYCLGKFTTFTAMAMASHLNNWRNTLPRANGNGAHTPPAQKLTQAEIDAINAELDAQLAPKNIFGNQGSEE